MRPGKEIGIELFESEILFESAIESAGYGKFHLMLLMLVGSTYSSIAMEVTLVSFVIPSAKCDFGMSSSDAGLLTALPMLGMTLGSFFWGCFADIGGRRLVLSSSLLLGGACGLLSSIAQYYHLFLVLRFVNGFALAGALSLCLPYLGEFHPNSCRERILSWMELFWTMGIISLPCLAWLIIPLEMRFESEHFRYDSWNLFVAVSAIPILALGGWAYTFPESPKFLMEIGEYDKSLEVLKYMFALNTGKDHSLFPVDSLREKGISSIEFGKLKRRREPANLRSALRKIGSVAKTLIKPPHRKNTILSCFISFGLTASYYTLMMWFPELFTRFEQYESLHPNMSSSVCEVSSVFLEQPGCNNYINKKVYMNTIIVGLACIPTSIWYPLCVHKLGAKFFMIFCLIVAGFVSIGMYFVTNSIENLILSCIFEAFTSLGVVTLFCALVELFPTNVRVMAAGLAICSGRLGALTGNLIFGYLIDFNCVIPIITFTILLFGTAALCAFLPIKKNKTLV